MLDAGRLHQLLLWADSWIADDLVVAARSWLGDGLAEDVVHAVGVAVLTAGIPVPAEFADLVAGTAPAADGPLTLPPIALAAVDPEVFRTNRALPRVLDLTSFAGAAGGPDGVDAEMVGAVRATAGAAALWRSWRYPVGTVDAGAKRGYLVLVAAADDGALPAIAAGLGRRSSEADPLIRVFRDESRLPEHHRMALDCGALLWSAAPAPPLRFLRSGAGGGPPSAEDRTYLAQGSPVMLDGPAWTADPTRPDPPMIRTDGTWIWRDAQDLSTVDGDFAEHRRRRGAAPAVDVVAVRRALAALCAAGSG
jgi:hypothetical protein